MKKLSFAFDIGHASIGWAVLDITQNQTPALKGCGTVLFPTDDCLASTRRQLRRQRRHIRSTRMRIARMKRLLAQLGVLSPAQLDEPGGPWPWKLASRVHAGGQLLSWREMWDVLRWYAHNRGYDSNKKWSKREDEDAEDTEKLANARKLMGDTHRETMAETITDFMFRPFPESKPYGPEMPALPFFTTKSRYKSQNCAFPREVVEKEVRRILEAHQGHLKGCDAALISVLMDDWRALPCEGVKLPGRYHGGLLFGQLVPRFDNRIISTCPISGEKVPSRNCPEFLNFRWAMQLANVQVARFGEHKLSPLRS